MFSGDFLVASYKKHWSTKVTCTGKLVSDKDIYVFYCLSNLQS